MVMDMNSDFKQRNTKKNITIIGAAIIDVLAGAVSSDVFSTGSHPVDTIEMSFGGDALNEAVVLSRMGKQVELISKLGDDEAGSRILDYIKEQGLSLDKITIEKELQTSINIVLVDKKGERFFLTVPKGSLRKLSAENILPYIDTAADIVSFASMFVSPLLDISAMEQIFRAVRQKPGRTLVVDMTKAKNGESLEDIRRLLPYIDYILPNESEIALLTGEKDPLINAERLVASGVSCAVIKCGSKGCIIRTREKCIQIPAYPTKDVIDSTGAGDCFAAGFLWGLSEHLSLEECGRLACAAASCSIEHMGAVTGIISLDEPLRRAGLSAAKFVELSENQL